jgi:hypothetical protein
MAYEGLFFQLMTVMTMMMIGGELDSCHYDAFLSVEEKER